MNIVIPMAGSGLRFKNSGFTRPKPLIMVADKPMYRQAVDSLPLHLANQLIFIIKEDEFSTLLAEDIRAHYSSVYPCTIVNLKEETRTMGETLLTAAPYLDLQLPSLIHNCDTHIQVDFNWQILLEWQIDGAMLLYHSHDPSLLFAEVDDQDFKVKSLRHKIIPNNALLDTFFIKNTRQLIHLISEIKPGDNSGKNPLFDVYHRMIRDDHYIIPLWVKKILHFGTPQSLVNSLNQILLRSTHFRQLFLET
ncbi:hypothetical protein DIZ81_13535 [Legionella taurinensis]|uniref:MobA-like NTP transferase domain-containing protein n=1 Tax=Legionella taurinensis TaxID=70611 RepID=A0AB38N2Y6_9GAMM|nr:hypothetical protein [Legionella taurinensis]MDX1838779.1 hypothetical protein [Legionella taurinensis]PUT38643.1 hypothetical protein DB744_13545 [Legionella taurinensis]PUT39841.1 hypothetical protein DB746_12945 [Legionella taurinensis]PUT41833.1 hypothetical protein DB743_13430 [Legionella taurinensis]PUT45328.1 hypothetical protein DB745_12885 [Legionella taurinensis]